jgi:ABC-type branched-subunit amino acid transport system substrate-binding protein
VTATRKRLRWVSVLTLVALIAVGCGSGRSGSADDGSTTDTGGSSEQASDGTSFGTMASPCGPGDASGATDQGVTDTDITIGYGDDAGYPQSPGLNHQMTDAVTALMKWCNEQGGINGREVKGNYYDGKITEANNAMAEACGQVFMLVGEGFALDGSAEETRVGCGLPAVPGYAVNPVVTMGPDLFMPIPQPIDIQPAGQAQALAEAYPEQVKKAASVYGNFASTIESKDRIEAAYPEFGWTFVGCDQEYPISGAVDWKPIAQKLKDCGVEVVYFTGAPFPNFENLLDAAKQIEYMPIWSTEGNFYEESFAAWNTSGNADNVYVRTVFTPFNQADSNPATKQYIELVQGEGGDISTLGAQAASAFLLWASVAKDCGSNLTRQCMVDGLSKVTEWDAGGLHAPTNPGENIPPDCAMALRMQGTEFTQWAPEEKGDFSCDPAFLVKVDIAAGRDAQIGPDRKSTKFTS